MLSQTVSQIAPSALKNALARLQESGFKAYAVGGAVRDALLGHAPTDWDITTSALPQEISAVFSDCRQIETGKKHGTVTVLLEGMSFEITTFRADGDYKDARHPDSVSFSKSLKEDVIRRDFTVNTLCWNENEGVIDLCGGLADLDAHILRAVGEPDRRFKEDALRILRGLRFSSQLGFEIEAETAKAIFKNRALINEISKERIREEFTSLLCGKSIRQVLLKFHKVIEEFIPELTPLIGCTQDTPYHCYDVFEHTLVATEHIEPVPLFRLIMFFHDFGKPMCKTIDANGISHFKGHQKVSAEIVEPILKRLRFDNKTIRMVIDRIAVHDLNAPRTKTDAKQLLSCVGLDIYKDLIKIKRADTRAKADPYAIDEKLSKMEALLLEVLESGECYSLKTLAVHGDDLQSAGIPKGKEIKEALDFLLGAVVSDACPNEKEALLNYLFTHEKTPPKESSATL